MTKKTAPRPFFKTLVACSIGILPASAQLPSIEEKGWLGHFVGFENDDLRFGFTAMGAGIITPMGRSGPAGKDRQVGLSFVVEEVMPDGKVVRKQLDSQSLKSEQAATKEPKNLVFTGSVTGGATFEGSIHEDRGILAVGGRMIDPGTLKNPLRFGVRLDFGAPYRYVKAEDRESRVFERRIKDDEIRVVWTDGKRVKQAAAEPVDASSPALNGPGIARLEYEADAFQGKKFLFDASENSRIVLENRPETPLMDGFTATWYPDPATDLEAAARLRFQLK